MISLLLSNKKVYFASDLHLTSTYDELSRKRERDFVKWLDRIKNDAAAIFLLGDIFDFLFEYRHVIPRGYARLMGKLAEMTDAGIDIHFFTGNHDQWMQNYLKDELNIKIYHKPGEFEINGKTFLVGHGHDISAGTLTERLQNFVFANPVLRAMYAWLHPRWGIALGKNRSVSSRKKHKIVEPFDGIEKELIYKYIKTAMELKHYDFFVFGHRHLALDVQLNEKSRYINTGEWIEKQNYAVFDGEKMELQR